MPQELCHLAKKLDNRNCVCHSADVQLGGTNRTPSGVPGYPAIFRRMDGRVHLRLPSAAQFYGVWRDYHRFSPLFVSRKPVFLAFSAFPSLPAFLKGGGGGRFQGTGTLSSPAVSKPIEALLSDTVSLKPGLYRIFRDKKIFSGYFTQNIHPQH
ncbi:MAG TPA: hypothetical protein VFB72_07910 [Verrucomicrobiae bacterium]|nr:hypothetical protein [Verrucomicrobiae bacterium]